MILDCASHRFQDWWWYLWTSIWAQIISKWTISGSLGNLFSYSLSLNLLAITMPSVQNQALPSFNLILHPTDPVLPNLSFPSWSYAILVLCTYSLVWVSSACPILGQSDFFFSLCVFPTEPSSAEKHMARNDTHYSYQYSSQLYFLFFQF
jgi:hypothetical protein